MLHPPPRHVTSRCLIDARAQMPSPYAHTYAAHTTELVSQRYHLENGHNTCTRTYLRTLSPAARLVAATALYLHRPRTGVWPQTRKPGRAGGKGMSKSGRARLILVHILAPFRIDKYTRDNATRMQNSIDNQQACSRGAVYVKRHIRKEHETRLIRRIYLRLRLVSLFQLTDPTPFEQRHPGGCFDLLMVPGALFLLEVLSYPVPLNMEAGQERW